MLRAVSGLAVWPPRLERAPPLLHPKELEQVVQLYRRVKAADHSQVIGVPNL
jgi:hypothetical protein